MENRSPWIHQLDKNRPRVKLPRDTKADVVVVGAGIAGISTAYFLLKHTELRVTVLEADILAHGATGHNAGYVVADFERSFSDLVEEFGLELTSHSVREVESAWVLLDEIYNEGGLTLPHTRVISRVGLATKAQVIENLEENLLRAQGHLKPHKILISEEAGFIAEIPRKYEGYYHVVPAAEVALHLETLDQQYHAVVLAPAAVLNSALFCEQVVTYLFAKYPHRFALYEHTPVGKIVLKDEIALIDAGEHTVECSDVVLCTNGFSNFEIIAPSGLSINTRYHHHIHGVMAFMTGFLERPNDPPATIYYYQEKDLGLTDNPGDPYFYLSRRPYEYEPRLKHNLVSIGGPDYVLEDRTKYSRHDPYPEEAFKTLETFVKNTFNKKELEYAFHWHGVMGYTTNLLRMVGPDPEQSRLYYNLGCNGIGILPSIFGGDKVARQIAGQEFAPSIFDIKERPVPLEERSHSLASANS